MSHPAAAPSGSVAMKRKTARPPIPVTERRKPWAAMWPKTKSGTATAAARIAMMPSEGERRPPITRSATAATKRPNVIQPDGLRPDAEGRYPIARANFSTGALIFETGSKPLFR